MKRILFVFLLVSLGSSGVKIDRVILGCDANPLYLEFWPMVAKTWKEIVGVRPTLALIASADVKIDESLGDVIRFEPISGIPTSLQAQVIRLLLPIYFPDDICIISDMDMIPLQRDYFVNAVAEIARDKFVVYKDGAFDPEHFKEYPMCYNVALGNTFKDIFEITSIQEIPNKIKEWYALGLGWTTDQQILYRSVNHWNSKTKRLVKLGHDVHPRVDRLYWRYNITHLRNKNYYIDCHMLRPYNAYRAEIDALMNHLFVN